MQDSLSGFRSRGTIALLSLLIASIGVLYNADHAAAGTFNPSGTACLDDETTAAACDGDIAPGAVSGITASFNLPEGDVNFGGIVAFTPPEWKVPPSSAIPLGAMVGVLESQATIGLIGGACNTNVQPTFHLMNATTDTSNILADAYGSNAGSNPGAANDQFDEVGGLPLGVTKYPDYLARAFNTKEDGTGTPVAPLTRLYSQTSVSGVDVSLSFLIFPPGADISDDFKFDSRLGFLSVTTLQNLGDPQIEPQGSAITDFCSPLATTTTTFGTTQDNLCTQAGGPPPECFLAGFLTPKPNPAGGTSPDEGNVVWRTNPDADGTYNFLTFAVGQRDADGDSYENGLDPCPFDDDTGWDPRTGSYNVLQPGDADGDRIPDSCDDELNGAPPLNPPSIDVDGDQYLNAGDNCPQIANGINTAGQVIGPNNQLDTDNDGIGDECDPNPTTADGAQARGCFISTVSVGSGGAALIDPQTVQPCDPNAALFTGEVGGGDGDGDGGGGGAGDGAGGGGTDVAGETQGAGGTGGGVGGPDTGIGSLAPAISSIPAWAAIASGLGGAGLLGSLAAFATRFLGIRRRE